MKEVKGNYKDKHRRKGLEEDLICQEWSEIDLPKMGGLREGLKLDEIEGMVKFFQLYLLLEKTKERTGSV